MNKIKILLLRILMQKMIVRKLFVLIVLFYFLDHTAVAQLAVGLKGGSNFSMIDVYKRPEFLGLDVKQIQGFQYGAVIRYVSEKHAGLTVEFLYSQKGWKHESLNEAIDTLYRRTIDYLEIPVMTHFIIGSKKIRILLEGGFYGSYALSSTYRTESASGETTSGEYQFVDEVDNRWDYGLIGSAGLQVFLPMGAFEAKAFYSFGYGNIFLDRNEAVEVSQNRVYGINFSYLYFFGKKKEESNLE